MHRYLIPAAMIMLQIGLAVDLAAQHTHPTDCSSCHTMHNSQGNLPMRYNEDASPLPKLLRGGCVDCHGGLGGSIVNSISASSSSQRDANRPSSPQVMSRFPPTYTWGDTQGKATGTLAGGDFYWVTLNDAFGHNVTSIPGIEQDGRLGTAPPGGPPLTSPLQCAGANGCHGDAEVNPDPLLSMAGGHHANVSGQTDGKTVGSSYRFLLNVMGVEDEDWERTVSATDHNHYMGEVRRVDTTPPRVGTMSGFCAKCHGDFHNRATGKAGSGEGGSSGFASPWIRHPNDYDMALRGEYSGYDAYDTKVPLARTTTSLAAGSNAAVASNQRVIMCLTCHRAHGSPNYAMLRWNYRAWPGPDGQDGCQICHTSKY